MLITMNSAKAAQRPLAGFGMGTHFCDGVLVDSGLSAAAPGMGAAKGIETAAALALPRVKWAVPASSEGYAPAGASGASRRPTTEPVSAQQFKAQQFDAQQFDAQQFEHMALAIPVYQGGVGPHPAREPEPV
ncbi:MAG: hypothetical protein ACLQFR_29515 [Streptosporangiaceae bacterium]